MVENIIRMEIIDETDDSVKGINYPVTKPEAVTIDDTTTLNDKIYYSTAVPTTATVGGVEVGTTYTNADLIQVLDDILHPYVAPKVAITTSKTATYYELGTSIDVTVTVTPTLGSKALTKVAILKNAVEDEVVTDSSNPVSKLYTLDTTTTFSGRVSDGTKTIDTSGSSKFTFIRPYYYGTIPQAELASKAEITADQIHALTKVVKPTGSQYSIPFSGSTCYQVLATVGTLSQVLDPNNFDYTAAWQSYGQVVSVDEYGTAVNYNVYISDVVGSAVTFKMKF